MFKAYGVDKELFCQRAMLLVVQPFTFVKDKPKFNKVYQLMQKCTSRKIPIILTEYVFDPLTLWTKGVEAEHKASRSLSKYATYLLKIHIKLIKNTEIAEEIDLIINNELDERFKVPPAQTISGKQTKYFQTVSQILVKIFELQKEKDELFLPFVIEEEHALTRDFLMVVGGYVNHCQRNYIKFLQKDILYSQIDTVYSFHAHRNKSMTPLKIVYFPGLSVTEEEMRGKRVTSREKINYLKFGKVGRRKIEQDLIVINTPTNFMNYYLS